jgi:y4mF family transcriptional regulator
LILIALNQVEYLTFKVFFRKMEHDNNLAKLIKQKRKRLKLTQVDLAQKAGVGLRFLRELESGKTTLRMDKVNQVLNLLGYELTAARKQLGE